MTQEQLTRVLVGSSMKTILLASVLLMTGCSSTTSLEDLEAEAMVSGDWSEVEKRERQMRAKKQTSEFDCESGMTLVCVDKGSGEECTCLRRGLTR